MNTGRFLAPICAAALLALPICAAADTANSDLRYRRSFENLVAKQALTALKFERKFRALAQKYKRWYSPADYNKDQITDAEDMNYLAFCLNSPRNGSLGNCVLADLDGNGNIDVVDMGLFGSYIDASNPTEVPLDAEH